MLGFTITRTTTPKIKKRRFDASKSYRQLTGWLTSSTSQFDEEIQTDLVSLRARSRDASLNDPYARSYFTSLNTNVIGPKGIELRMQIIDANGKQDEYANDVISRAWKGWAKNVTIDGLNWIQAQKLFLGTVARDGECVIIILKGRKYGKYGLKLKFVEAEYLDEQFNLQLDNGNYIRAAVEYTEEGEKVAYHIYKSLPSDKFAHNKSTERIRIPAEQVIHGYSKERISQGRGYPWLAASLISLTHLKEYQKTELVAARVSSAKMGFFTRAEGDTADLGDEEDPDDSNAMVSEVNPGSFDVLPDGYNLQTFDTDNPNGNFGGFVKVVLRSVSASLGISSTTLSGDLESVNYSSARTGMIAERETYKDIQEWIISSLMTPIFETWLEMSLLSGALSNPDKPMRITLPIGKYDKFNKPEFRPRTWSWVDPSKEATAIKTKLEYGLASKQDLIRELGREYEDVVAEIAAEQKLADELGVTYIKEATPATPEIEIEPITDEEAFGVGDKPTEQKDK